MFMKELTKELQDMCEYIHGRKFQHYANIVAKSNFQLDCQFDMFNEWTNCQPICNLSSNKMGATTVTGGVRAMQAHNFSNEVHTLKEDEG